MGTWATEALAKAQAKYDALMDSPNDEVEINGVRYRKSDSSKLLSDIQRLQLMAEQETHGRAGAIGSLARLGRRPA